MARFEASDDEFNALLICDLFDLKAVESVKIISRAYAAGKVDQGMVAWEDVQRELGVTADHPGTRPSSARPEAACTRHRVGAARKQKRQNIPRPWTAFSRWERWNGASNGTVTIRKRKKAGQGQTEATREGKKAEPEAEITRIDCFATRERRDGVRAMGQ